MRSNIVLAVLIALSNTALADDTGCFSVPDVYKTDGPFTLDELEAWSLSQIDKINAVSEKKIQRVPFENGIGDWNQFKSFVRPEDQLFRYQESCCKGIILIRNGCIVRWFYTEAQME